MARKNTLQQAKSRNELLRTQLANKVTEARLTMVDKVKADFESLRWTPGRSRPAIETGAIEDTALPMHKRLLSVSEARHLDNNDLNVSALLDTIKTFSVGTEGGKVIFTSADQTWNTAAGKYFNTQWAKNCDYRQSEVFNTILGQVLISIVRDGDCLIVCDADLTEGKLLTFEADQICEIAGQDWKNEAVKRGYSELVDGKAVPLKQVQGVVLNRLGKVMYYVTHSGHGAQSVAWKDATVFPASICRLVKDGKRLNQVRGVSKLIPMVDTLHDLRQILKSEVQSAKVISERALIIKQRDPASAIMAESGMSPEDLAKGTGETLNLFVPRKYEALEEGFGGVVEHVSKDDEFQFVENTRPSRGIAEFVTYSVSVAGKALGLFNCFSTGKVDASYSAARAEILLTYATFSKWQKVLERGVMDFAVPLVIQNAVKAGELPAMPEDFSFRCDWPVAIQLDPDKEISAAEKRLKAGLSTFSEELGANSEQKLDKLGEEKKGLEKRGLTNLTFFQATGGSQVQPADQKTA